ncbi:MAG: hypothetical protein ABIE94_03370 [archaeon]
MIRTYRGYIIAGVVIICLVVWFLLSQSFIPKASLLRCIGPPGLSCIEDPYYRGGYLYWEVVNNKGEDFFISWIAEVSGKCDSVENVEWSVDGALFGTEKTQLIRRGDSVTFRAKCLGDIDKNVDAIFEIHYAEGLTGRFEIVILR